MGGESTGCSEATTDVFVECAWFDPIRTARPGRATASPRRPVPLRSRRRSGLRPAGDRTGHPPDPRALRGEASDVTLAGELPAPPAPIVFDPTYVRHLAGVEIRAKACKKSYPPGISH